MLQIMHRGPCGIGAPRGPGPITVGRGDPAMLGACDSSFRAAHCSRLLTKQIVESVDAHFVVSSLLAGNELCVVFSKKTCEIRPFEEKQPPELQTVHISSLHAERSPVERSHFFPSGMQGERYRISAPRLVLVDYLCPDGPILILNTEEAVKRYARNIQDIPRLT